MKLLLTNDDGIDAPGLAALAEVAAAHGHLTWIAPHTHLSGCGHRVTTDKPIQLMRRDENRWAIDGTPADCVRVGLAKVAPDVDWVLSGLNHGGNLGADVFHSGTVAAVREAALHGKPGIALSHYRKRGVEIDWPRARRWMALVLADLLARPWTPGMFWNVNLPHPGRRRSRSRVSCIVRWSRGRCRCRFGMTGSCCIMTGTTISACAGRAAMSMSVLRGILR